jgi:large subunit ribosomal protein L2
MTGLTYEEITKKAPEKALIVPQKGRGGRNAQGKVTVRHRGAGAKRRLRELISSGIKPEFPDA